MTDIKIHISKTYNSVDEAVKDFNKRKEVDMEQKFYVKYYDKVGLVIKAFNSYEKALAYWDKLQVKGIQAFIQKPSY